MVKPLSYLSDKLCIETVVWDIQRNDELSGSGDGRVWQAELAPPLWTAEITVNPNYHKDIKKIAALIRGLKGSKESFMLSDPLSKKLSNSENGEINKSSFSYNFFDRSYFRDNSSVSENSSVSISRTGSSTVWDIDGTMKTVAANNPRFMYDPSEVNYAWPSEDLTDSRWLKTRMTATLAHDWNGYQFTRLTPDTTLQSSHQVTQTNAMAFNASSIERDVCVSFIVKQDGSDTNRIAIRCYDSIGFITYVFFNMQNGTTSGAGASMVSIGDGYWKVSVTFKVRAGTTGTGIQIFAASPNGNATTTHNFNGVDGYLVSAVQIEWGGGR